MDDTDKKPEQLADDLDRQADELERRGDELEHGIDAARTDWEQKRADPAVPGAQPRAKDEPGPSDHGDPKVPDSAEAIAEAGQ